MIHSMYGTRVDAAQDKACFLSVSLVYMVRSKRRINNNLPRNIHSELCQQSISGMAVTTVSDDVDDVST